MRPFWGTMPTRNSSANELLLSAINNEQGARAIKGGPRKRNIGSCGCFFRPVYTQLFQIYVEESTMSLGSVTMIYFERHVFNNDTSRYFTISNVLFSSPDVNRIHHTRDLVMLPTQGMACSRKCF